jgi:hypothetical protein
VCVCVCVYVWVYGVRVRVCEYYSKAGTVTGEFCVLAGSIGELLPMWIDSCFVYQGRGIEERSVERSLAHSPFWFVP